MPKPILPERLDVRRCHHCRSVYLHQKLWGEYCSDNCKIAKRLTRKMVQKLRGLHSGRVKKALKGVYGPHEERSLLPKCSDNHLANHLSSQFQEGMTWANKGADGWHIDHIVPCSLFDLQQVDHQRVCFDWRNLRPLWGKENISRGNRVTLRDLDLLDADYLKSVRKLGIRLPFIGKAQEVSKVQFFTPS